MNKIICEFREIASGQEAGDKFLLRRELPAVPDKGELISVEGMPYVIFDRGWAIGEEGDMFCYMRVSPYSLQCASEVLRASKKDGPV